MNATRVVSSPLPLTLVIASVIALAATGNLVSLSPYVIAAQALAVVLNLWARTSFAKGTFRVAASPGGSAVIRTGPYRLVRHPMYAAVILFVWASVAGHPNLLAISIGAFATIVIIVRVVVEDRVLREKLPGYTDYAKTTKALIPFVA